MARFRPARVLLAGALVAACGLSLAANAFLLARARHFERMFYLARLDPLGLGAFDGAPPGGGGAQGRRVVFFGDSRAADWHAPPLTGAEILNRGIPGHTSAQALLRFDAHVAPLKPDVVVVQVGANDLASLALLRQDRERIVAATRQNIAAIVAKARAGGAEVVLTTIFPLAASPWPERAVQGAIAEVNGALRAMAAPGVLVLDADAVLAGPDGYVLPAYAEDDLHLAPAGYAALNAALAPLLGGEGP